MVHDKYYGFQELAELSEHVITSLFAVAPTNVGVGRPGIDTPPHSPVLVAKDSPPPLGEFIAYALYRTRLPDSITHQALLLLSRLKARYPSARGTSTSPHRLFLSSLMLSSKISMDDTYSNKSWQVVGQGLFTLREVNQMERELFAFLGWNVVVRDEELTAFVRDVVNVFEMERRVGGVPSTSSLASSRDASEVPASSGHPDSATPAALVAAAAPSPSPRAEKRLRRSVSPSSTSSRSPSPEADRHRRASDAAVALLQGSNAPTMSVAPLSSTSQPKHASSSSHRGRRSRNRTPEPHVAGASASFSPLHHSRPPSTYSTSSSGASSPRSSASGYSSPSSPSTPVSVGPLTPAHHAEHHLPPPAWSRQCSKEDVVQRQHYDGRASVEVAAW